MSKSWYKLMFSIGGFLIDMSPSRGSEVRFCSVVRPESPSVVHHHEL